MTLIQIVLLFLQMPLFDPLTFTFGPTGTRRFWHFKTTSIASYSAYNQNVITVFMMLYSVNFTYSICCSIGFQACLS